MNTEKITTSFSVIEAIIAEGEARSLVGWWKAGEECVTLEVSVSTYAAAASKVAVRNTENTIRLYVGAIVRAIKLGYTLADFPDGRGIEHVRATVKSNKVGNTTKVANVGGLKNVKLSKAVTAGLISLSIALQIEAL